MPDTKGFVKMNAGVNLDEGLDIQKAQSYMNKLESIFKVLSDNGQALAGAMSRTTEKLSRDFYVSTDQAANAMKAMKAVQADNKRLVPERIGVDGSPSIPEHTSNPIFVSNKTEPVDMVSFRRKVEETNKRKLQEMQALVSRGGGSMTPDTQDGYYNFTVPNASYTSDKGKATTFDRYIRAKITRQNKSVHERLSASASDSERDAYATEYEQIQSRINKMHSNEQAKARAVSEDKQDDEKGGQTGDKSINTIKSLSQIMFVAKILQKLYDVVKSIADSILSTAGRAFAATREGYSLGLSGSRVMEYTYAETAKGLEPGTITKAIESTSAKFQNITALDLNALRQLAVVLGPEIEKLVKSGIGGDNPEQLTNMILKGFIDKALKGENSVGMQVGTSRAIIELSEYLKKIDPNWANIFTRMMLDITSPNTSPETKAAARAGMTAWADQSVTVHAELDPNKVNNGVVLTNLRNDLKATNEGVKDDLLLRLTPYLIDIIGFLRMLARPLMSQDDRVRDKLSTQAHNEEVKKQFIGYRALLWGAANADISEIASHEQDPNKRKELESTLNEIVKNPTLAFEPGTSLNKKLRDIDKYLGTYGLYDEFFDAIANYITANEATKSIKAIDKTDKSDNPVPNNGTFSTLTELGRAEATKTIANLDGDKVRNGVEQTMGPGSELQTYFSSKTSQYDMSEAIPTGIYQDLLGTAHDRSLDMQALDLLRTMDLTKYNSGQVSDIKVHYDGQYMQLQILDNNNKVVGQSDPIQYVGVRDTSSGADERTSKLLRSCVNLPTRK